MKVSTLTAIIVCAPAALIAQQASGAASATATASTQTSVTIPASYSAQAHADIEAAFKRAQEKNVPDQAMRARMAEGQAKGATDAQVAAAVQKTEARLEASQAALIRAGNKNPTPEQVEAGAQTAAAASVNANGSNSSTSGAAAVAGSASAGVGAAVSGAGNAAAGVGATVSGTVKGVLAPKKP